MTFFEFMDDYRVFRKQDTRNRQVSPEKLFLNMLSKEIPDKFAQANWVRRIHAQREFYKWGKPYIKVFPAMASYLCQTKIDIGCQYLKPAYPTIEIRLPLEDNELEDGGIALHTILAHFTEKWVHLYLDFGWNHEGSGFGVYYECEFALEKDKTLAQAIEDMPYMPTSGELVAMVEGRRSGPGRLSREFVRSVVALTVATNFFLTSQHEIIAPDIKRKHIDRYLTAKAKGDEKEMALLVEKSRRDGHTGWTLGSEIKLPRDIVRYHRPEGTSSERTWEMRWAHVRSGHLRLQPVGERGSGERKLIFVMPTVIRPDLPMRPRVGYRIEDDSLP